MTWAFEPQNPLPETYLPILPKLFYQVGTGYLNIRAFMGMPIQTMSCFFDEIGVLLDCVLTAPRDTSAIVMCTSQRGKWWSWERMGSVMCFGPHSRWWNRDWEAWSCVVLYTLLEEGMELVFKYTQKNVWLYRTHKTFWEWWPLGTDQECKLILWFIY